MKALLLLSWVLLAAPPGQPAPTEAGAAPAEAEAAAPPPEAVARARELFIAGTNAYLAGNYAVAIESFEEANRLVERPSVIFSLAQALRLQYYVDGKPRGLERAVQMYRKYVDMVPSGGEREVAVGHLGDLVPLLRNIESASEPTTGRLIVSCSVPGAIASIDGGDKKQTPATFQLEPGSHTVLIEAPEYQPRTIEALTIAGGAVPVPCELVPQPGRLTVNAPEGARVVVAGRLIGDAPVGVVELPPGRHPVLVGQSGRRLFQEQVDIARAGATSVDARLEMSGQRLIAWALIGTGAVVAVGAGVSGAFTLESEAVALELYDKSKTGTLSIAEVEDYDAARSDRDVLRQLTTGLGVAAGVMLATGGALWFFDSPNLTGLSPTVTPEGGPAISGQLRF